MARLQCVRVSRSVNPLSQMVIDYALHLRDIIYHTTDSQEQIEETRQMKKEQPSSDNKESTGMELQELNSQALTDQEDVDSLDKEGEINNREVRQNETIVAVSSHDTVINCSHDPTVFIPTPSNSCDYCESTRREVMEKEQVNQLLNESLTEHKLKLQDLVTQMLESNEEIKAQKRILNLRGTQIEQLLNEKKKFMSENNKLTEERNKLSHTLKKEQEKSEKMKNVNSSVITSLKNEVKTKESDLKHSTEQQKRLVYTIRQNESLIQQLKVNNSDLEDKNRRWQTDFQENMAYVSQLESLVQDFKNKLHEEEQKKEDAQNRLSKLAGQMVRHDNPAITDLSDSYRPEKLKEKLRALYDTEWTDLFEELLDKEKEEEEAIGFLLDILEKCYKICETARKMQNHVIETALLSPFCLIDSENEKERSTDTSDALTIEEREEYLQWCKKYGPNAASKAEQVCLQKLKFYVEQNHSDVKLTTLDDYIKKCGELCWWMCLNNPPLMFECSVAGDKLFRTDFYKEYTSKGMYVEFIVWPAIVQTQTNQIIERGVAQGTKTRPSDKENSNDIDINGAQSEHNESDMETDYIPEVTMGSNGLASQRPINEDEDEVATKMLGKPRMSTDSEREMDIDTDDSVTPGSAKVKKEQEQIPVREVNPRNICPQSGESAEIGFSQRIEKGPLDESTFNTEDNHQNDLSCTNKTTNERENPQSTVYDNAKGRNPLVSDVCGNNNNYSKVCTFTHSSENVDEMEKEEYSNEEKNETSSEPNVGAESNKHSKPGTSIKRCDVQSAKYRSQVETESSLSDGDGIDNPTLTHNIQTIDNTNECRGSKKNGNQFRHSFPMVKGLGGTNDILTVVARQAIKEETLSDGNATNNTTVTNTVEIIKHSNEEEHLLCTHQQSHGNGKPLGCDLKNNDTRSSESEHMTSILQTQYNRILDIVEVQYRENAPHTSQVSAQYTIPLNEKENISSEEEESEYEVTFPLPK